MAVKAVLRMGDPRLLERAHEVEQFGTPELDELLRDMHDTMEALNGAGLAAPQIAVPLRVVVFGLKSNPRYPDAEAVPYTVLINPVITPLGDEEEEGCSAKGSHRAGQASGDERRGETQAGGHGAFTRCGAWP